MAIPAETSLKFVEVFLTRVPEIQSIAASKVRQTLRLRRSVNDLCAGFCVVKPLRLCVINFFCLIDRLLRSRLTHPGQHHTFAGLRSLPRSMWCYNCSSSSSFRHETPLRPCYGFYGTLVNNN